MGGLTYTNKNGDKELYFLLWVLFLGSPVFSQESKVAQISSVHEEMGIKRVGYGYKFSVDPRKSIDVYKVEIESNDEKTLSAISPRFKFASMSDEDIDHEIRFWEVKAWLDRKAWQEEKDPAKKAELKEAMDVSAKTRNDNNYWNRMTATLGPIYYRIVGPDKQLGNVLEEFWYNHFNVSMKSQRSLISYRRMIRSHIQSTFYEMLLSTAKHPAMLNYLDQRVSRKGRINENYAREVLELHTLGDAQLVHYSQEDIVGVANILTGWTWSQKEVDGKHRLNFVFNEEQNDPIAVSVFKEPNVYKTEEGSNIEKGEMLFKHLANHPATKEHICKKLHKWFIGSFDDIAITKCMKAWGVDGNLKAVYEAMLDIQDIHRNYTVKDRNPFELVIARERILQNEMTYDHLKKLHDEIKYLGMEYQDISPPTGYADINKQMSGSRLVSWIKSSASKLKPNPKISQYLLQNYGEEQGFDPTMRYLKGIGDKSIISAERLGQSIYQPFIDRKNNEADVYATFSFKTITAPEFMRK